MNESDFHGKVLRGYVSNKIRMFNSQCGISVIVPAKDSSIVCCSGCSGFFVELVKSVLVYEHIRGCSHPIIEVKLDCLF
jgi:hypothetical protein